MYVFGLEPMWSPRSGFEFKEIRNLEFWNLVQLRRLHLSDWNNFNLYSVWLGSEWNQLSGYKVPQIKYPLLIWFFFFLSIKKFYFAKINSSVKPNVYTGITIHDQPILLDEIQVRFPHEMNERKLKNKK